MEPHIYLISLDQELEPACFSRLSDFVRKDKRDRILKQKVKKQADTMLVGELLAMYAIRNVFGVPMRDQEIRCDERGKPFLASYDGIWFNISHSRRSIAVAVCDTKVGIDLQKVVPYRSSLANRICSEEERQNIVSSPEPDKAFTECWTRKEAAVKWSGEGIAAIGPSMEMPPHCESFFWKDCYVSVAWGT